MLGRALLMYQPALASSAAVRAAPRGVGHSRYPRNVAIADQLVEIYVSQQRLPEATCVVDAVKAALRESRSPFTTSASFTTACGRRTSISGPWRKCCGCRRTTGANNDLGYTWADDGKNLDLAESMIRLAVGAAAG